MQGRPQVGIAEAAGSQAVWARTLVARRVIVVMVFVNFMVSFCGGSNLNLRWK